MLRNSRFELVERYQDMVDLADQLTAEGVMPSDNPYNAVGSMPTAAEEDQLQLTQRLMTADIMEQKQRELLTSMTPEQQDIFVDNMSSMKWMHVIPQGKYRSLINSQMGALINIHLLVPKTKGPLCPHCSGHNKTNEYELCLGCSQVQQQTVSRHNFIRDKIATHAKRVQGIEPSTEPKVFTNQPNNNNNQRADLSIRAVAGQQEQHEFYGLFDFMTKVVFSTHTAAARANAATKALQDGITDPIKIARKRIQAALEVGVAQKKRNYEEAAAMGIKVTALLISTGGTMHKTFYRFIRKLFSDSTLRSRVLTDISVALARGRANLYRHVYRTEAATLLVPI